MNSITQRYRASTVLITVGASIQGEIRSPHSEGSLEKTNFAGGRIARTSIDMGSKLEGQLASSRFIGCNWIS